MTTSYLLDNITLSRPVIVAAGISDQVVSKEASLTLETAINFVSTITVSSVVLGVGEQLLLKLQQYNGLAWQDVDSMIAGVPVTTDGQWHIYLDEGVSLEAAVLPLHNRIRFVISAGSSSSCVVTSVILNKNLN